MLNCNVTRLRPATTEEAGSALLLVPVVFVVTLLFGAMSLDAARVFLAHRELSAAASAAANDAASGFDQAGYFAAGSYQLDASAVSFLVGQTLDTRRDDLLDASTVQIRRLDDDRLLVRLESDVPLVLTGHLPGVPDRLHIRVDAEAQAQQGNP